METYRFFHGGRWRGIGDTVWLGWVFRWRVVSIYDDGVVVLQRGDRLRSLRCKVRVS
jgi:hypothetical protein